MVNLLTETLGKLTEHGKSPAAVTFVLSAERGRWGQQGEDHWCTWDEFAAIADREYDGSEVATWLKVVGGDWWLERHEYDGSEWWEFKTTPIRPEQHRADAVVFDY
jgi:hypothetical protein